MSITPNDLSFFFKNIQKSHNAASAFLDRLSDGPYDFLFFQELQGKIYWRAADITSSTGLEVFGTPIHPDWECLPPPARNSQVAIYVHKRITTRYHITVNHAIFHHPNIFLCSLFNPADNTTLNFINLYNNPNHVAPQHLQNAVTCLLQFLPLLSSIHLIQGDFNLHCSFWDPLVDSDDPIAWRLINDLCACGLALVNDDGIPTFFCPPNRPQVLDLVWLHEDASLPLTIDIAFNMTGPSIDHRELSLLCRDGSDNHSYLWLSARFLPSGSDEELDLVLFVLAGSHSWANGSVNHRATALLHLFGTGWDRFAKTGVHGSSFNKWWSRDCSQAKAV